MTDRWGLGNPAISVRVREVVGRRGECVRGAKESFKFEVSSLRSVGFKTPNAVAPNEPNSLQTQGRDGEAVGWGHKPSMMNDAPLAGQEVERLKP